MNINEVYTSLSRCQNIDNVYFKYTTKLFKEHEYEQTI